MTPIIIRIKNAPEYCGMNRKRFNREVRPLLTTIPIGKTGIGFLRDDLNAWAENLKKTQGISTEGRIVWEKNMLYPACGNAMASGTLKKWSTERAYLKALASVREQKRKKY